MRAKLLLFGIAKDIIGQSELELTLQPATDVAALKRTLAERYPALPSFMLAVNAEYAPDELVIRPRDEIAVIPPTSGG